MVGERAEVRIVVHEEGESEPLHEAAGDVDVRPGREDEWGGGQHPQPVERGRDSNRTAHHVLQGGARLCELFAELLLHEVEGRVDGRPSRELAAYEADHARRECGECQGHVPVPELDADHVPVLEVELHQASATSAGLVADAYEAALGERGHDAGHGGRGQGGATRQLGLGEGARGPEDCDDALLVGCAEGRL